MRLSGEQRRDRGVCIGNVDDSDSIDLRTTEDEAIEGDGLEESARFPTLQAPGASPYVLVGPKREIGEGIG